MRRWIKNVWRRVNQLKGHGYNDAETMCILYVFLESDLLTERLNAEAASNAAILRLAMGGLLDKGASTEFNKLVKKAMQALK